MVLIDITSDDVLTLTQACAILPRGRNSSRPHLSTILRWILHGAPSLDGRRVRLSAVGCGGKWITSRAALREFTEALTPRHDDATLPARTPTARRRGNALAAKRLENAGI
jgi:hypothetical protein